jgi:hypothetical protein
MPVEILTHFGLALTNLLSCYAWTGFIANRKSPVICSKNIICHRFNPEAAFHHSSALALHFGHMYIVHPSPLFVISNRNLDAEVYPVLTI